MTLLQSLAHLIVGLGASVEVGADNPSAPIAVKGNGAMLALVPLLVTITVRLRAVRANVVAVPEHPLRPRLAQRPWLRPRRPRSRRRPRS